MHQLLSRVPSVLFGGKGEDIVLDSYGVRFSFEFRSLDKQQFNNVIPTFLQREKQQNPIKSCKNITITAIETS